MKYKSISTGLLLLLLLVGCKEDWDKHYNSPPPTVDMNVWDAIQQNGDLSKFVEVIKEFKFDTLFQKDDTWTLFIPDNEALAAFLDTTEMTPAILNYMISPTYVQSVTINGKRKIQTLDEKYALFERKENKVYMDGSPTNFESPLYKNGKFFIMDKVGIPKPSLYEYFALNSPVLAKYIDDKDSIILDKEKSRPIGFDEFGNTIYDSVAIIYNRFEVQFFPVREEFRNKTATIVFPNEEDYQNALTDMAQSMQSIYQDYKDIPMDWQQNILVPYLLKQGVFENMMEPQEFVPHLTHNDTFKLKNILGDSIIIKYGVTDQAICSNGYAYNYSDFTVPDTLYKGRIRFEAEKLLERTGIGKFGWKDSVTYMSDVPFAPLQEYIQSASGDSILKVNFSKGYIGQFKLGWKVKTLFPRKYLMVFRTRMYTGGIYDIYVNDELVTTFDYKAYTAMSGVIKSVTGKYYVPKDGFNNFDCWVQDDAPYGNTTVRLEYKGPSSSTLISPGLVIDYVDFIPYD